MGLNAEAMRELERVCEGKGKKLIIVDKLHEDYIKHYHALGTVYIERNTPTDVISTFIMHEFGSKLDE